MSSSVSKKGSYCRCSGRAMVQKRLLSVNPAEPKMTRWVLASCANAGVGRTTRVETNITRSTSTEGTHTDNMGLVNVERLIRHLPRFYLLSRKGASGLHVPHTCSPAMALASQQRHISPFPRKDCLRSLVLPLYVFTLSTPSQHCTYAVTFPSETITCASYATQNAWHVNCACIFAIDREGWLLFPYLWTTPASPNPCLTTWAELRCSPAGCRQEGCIVLCC